MIYRKIWFDYVFWAVYAGLCITLLALVGNRMYDFYVGAPLAGLGTFILFPVLLCLYPAIRLSSRAMRKKQRLSNHFLTLTESLVISVSFVFGTILRIKEGLLMESAYNLEPALKPGDYYELAVVRTGGWGMSFAHGMGDLFVRSLRIVLSFLGNSVAAAMLFQVFLQVAAMIFACLAVRKAAGRFASCAVLLLLAFSGPFIRKIDVIDPECLLTALFLAGLYLVLSFVRAQLAGREVFGGWPGTFLLGAFLGLLCYLEGGCAILFLFLAGLLTGKQSTGKGWKRWIASLLIVLAGGGAGFFGSIAEDAAANGVVFYQGLMWWADTYLHPVMTGGKMAGMTGMEYPFLALLFLLASFVVFEFIRGGREQDLSLWFLPCILITPAFFFELGVVSFGGVALFFWCVMAGLGLKNAVLGGQAEALREQAGEISAPSLSEPEAEAPKTRIPAAEMPEAPAQTAVPGETPQEKPRFIENPLPLPKKHVKREMDYDYSILEADMHFDVEVTEEDDFDFEK